MEKRFTIRTIVENGYPHYEIKDHKQNQTVHCDFAELNEILYELIGEE